MNAFFDDDGKAYVVNNDVPTEGLCHPGHRAIWMRPFDIARLTPIGPRKMLLDGGCDGDILRVVLRRCQGEGKQSLASIDVPADTQALSLKIGAEGGHYAFAHRAGHGWQWLRRDIDGTVLSTDVAGGFIGTTVGPYAHLPIPPDQALSMPIPFRKLCVTTIGAMSLATGSLHADTRTDSCPWLDTRLGFEQRAADLVGRMTLQEKVSQMQNSAPAVPRLGVPAYDWWNEALHGVARAGQATVFPQAIGMAASFDPALLREEADAISDEARAKYDQFQRQGLHGRYEGLTFWSPNINIFRDPRWGRG